MDVVVVESPAKAKTINKYLGRNYKVLASYGHVRDLPAKDGSVRPDDDFSMSWEVDGPSSKRLTEIANAVKDADGLILATDPDREGEAISWHVLEVLKNKRVMKDKPVSRVVFNAITKQSVLDAMAHPRQIDAPLVDAYLARRALDYLVGFTLSPVLWRKLPGSRSAGRVQSVALRLVSDREVEIEKFIREDYWQIAAILGTPRADSFEARLTGFEGKRLQKLDVSSQAQADDIRAMLEGASFSALSVEAKPTRRNPGPPFTTSTLQQAASSRLGFSATRTMQIAQRLYEGLDIGGETAGLITYMRTDGVQMAPEAIDAARAAITKEFGEKYLPEKPRYYSTKAKNAQEAHEAIRPTDFFRTPGSVRQYLDADQFRLYEMIWRRAIASQMQPAEIERTTAEIEAVNGSRAATLRAVGSVVRFDGFIAAYTDQKEDDAEDEEDRRLPEIRAGETLKREKIDVSKHTTEPPPRYTEATLIKKMEELGIGRPSTYTAILKTLEDREYVAIDKRRLIPQAKGRLLSAFLESFFAKYVEYDFTASLEEKLDEISDGKLEYKVVLRDFWRDFSASVDDIKDLRISQVLDALNEDLAPLLFPARADGSDPRICPKCGTGNLSLRLGKSGGFIGCSNYPECSYTRQFGAENAENGGESEGPKVLGKDPYTSEEITLRSGRFGPYVQRGDGKEAKRSSLPKGWTPDSIDHEKALALLALPRDVGQHPESGKMISAGLGRYGPFVLHDGTYANLESIEDVFSIGLNRAVSVIAEKVSKGRGGRNGGTPAALKELGEHPDGGKITVRDGKYGPYVNHEKINATLPKGRDPMSVTLEDALALIAEKAAKGGGGKKSFRRASSTAKPAAKKTAAKKPAAKKVAAKKKA
ncbi:type I DNA topoisomerase [Mesorhizobium sp. KR9-304]|uniref:type I DNA topoisomerase n=1 Tax=Mesorhizobium sp. KR9-304 TaxID=3156614 RepID=UPI0032B4CBF8